MPFRDEKITRITGRSSVVPEATDTRRDVRVRRNHIERRRAYRNAVHGHIGYISIGTRVEASSYRILYSRCVR